MSKLILKYLKPSNPFRRMYNRYTKALDRVTRNASELGLKGLGYIGKLIGGLATSGASTDFGLTSPFVDIDRLTVHNARQHAAERGMEKVGPWLSPTNHVAAWMRGSLNPRVGAEYITRLDPRILLATSTADIVIPVKAPKVVKGATRTISNTRKAYTISKEIDKIVRKNLPKIKTPLNTEIDVRDNVTLHRANPTKIKDPEYKGQRYGDYSGLYVGKWFTDESAKPNWYASNMAKRGEEPAYYLVTVPRYWAELQRAGIKISNPRIEFEPEDYILEDGILGLTGQLYQGKPGTISYLQQSFRTPRVLEPRTSLKFYERRPSRISEAERQGIPKGERNNVGGIHPDNIYGNLRFIRNIDGLPSVTRRGILLRNPDYLLANFTTDLPFRLHSRYSKIPGSTYMIISPRAFKGQRFMSIHPGDSFLPPEPVEPRFIRIISGDPEILLQASRLGMRTTTSSKLMLLYKINKDIRLREFDLGLNGGVRDFGNVENAASNLKWNRLLPSDYPAEGVVTPYRAEVDRIITEDIGRPSIEDYRTLERMTGLSADIYPTFLSRFIENARDELANLSTFLNVYYDFTPSIEHTIMDLSGLYPKPFFEFNNYLRTLNWLDKHNIQPLLYKVGGILK